MKKVLVLMAAAMFFAAGTAHADLVYSNAIASWDNNGQPGTQASTTGAGAANITAMTLSRGAGLTGGTGSGSLNTSGWNNEATDYIQFGFTVAAGYTATLSDLYIGTKSSATGPGTMGIYYSTDNFATLTLLTTLTENGTSYVNSDINLSGIGAVTGNLGFRISEIGKNSANGGTTGSAGTFRVSSYYPSGTYIANQITGTVAQDTTPTPIPAAFWLLGSGLMGLVGIKRKNA